jgi:endodeoxyribonuclease rusA
VVRHTAKDFFRARPRNWRSSFFEIHDSRFTMRRLIDVVDTRRSTGGRTSHGEPAQDAKRRVSAFLPMKPPSVTHNALVAYIVGGGKGMHAAIRKSDELKTAEDLICVWLKSVTKVSENFQPLTGPLRCVVKWCFPASEKHPDGTPMTEKPDMSNMLKTFEDCLTRCGIIEDDRFICSESLDKGYADIMGIYFSVEEL